MLKSPASTIFFRFLSFVLNVLLKWVSHSFISLLGDLKIILSINVFRFSTLYFNRKRLNCIAVYAQVFSWFSGKTFMYRIKNSSPLTIFSCLMEDLTSWKLKIQIFAERCIVYSCFWRTRNAKFEVNCRGNFYILFIVCSIYTIENYHVRLGIYTIENVEIRYNWRYNPFQMLK